MGSANQEGQKGKQGVNEESWGERGGFDEAVSKSVSLSPRGRGREKKKSLKTMNIKKTCVVRILTFYKIKQKSWDSNQNFKFIVSFVLLFLGQ